MNRIKIPKFILITCCLLISLISIDKLDALTANTYIRLNGSDTDLNDGYFTYFKPNTNLIFNSIYYLNETGNLDYYITTSVIFCSSYGVDSVYNNESEFLVSTKIDDIGLCEFDGVSGRYKQKVTWVQYLPVINSNTQAAGQVFIKFVNDKSWNLGVQLVSKSITVQSAGVYEQQQTIDKQQQTNDKLDETNSFLKDNSEPNSDISALGNVQGLLPAGPVDTLLNIPFTFLSIVSSSLSGTCVPLTGVFVFGSTLTIPCFGNLFYNNVPAALMIFINLIPSAFILINYFKHLYKKVDRAVSLQTTAEDEWGVI